MVRLIMSGKGEGKTKQLMELMENAPDDKARREVERVVSRIS